MISAFYCGESQPKKTTLAIGDGINDIEMMSKASIAVALHGNNSCETLEGANNSLRRADFAIG
jgi:P-type E1-E2 ATPase